MIIKPRIEKRNGILFRKINIKRQGIYFVILLIKKYLKL